MMSISVRCIAILLIAVASSTVHAQGARAQLTIDGVIRPPACTPVFSVPGGVVDYGTIPRSTLTPGAKTTLSATDVVMTITCSDATRLSMEVIDNRAGNRPADAHDKAFGLGAVDRRPIGIYEILGSKLMGDGTPTNILWTLNQGATWGAASGALLPKNLALSWGESSPMSFTVFSMTLNIKPIIERPESLPAGTDIPLDGSSTFQFSYL